MAAMKPMAAPKKPKGRGLSKPKDAKFDWSKGRYVRLGEDA